MSNKIQRPITMVISALGGQGGGVLTNWLVNLAEQCGYFAQSTSVPGVAQRTGATIYYLEIFPKSPAQNKDKPPVMALMPLSGDVDLVVAAELMEAGRAVQRQFVTPNKTTLITSSHRVFSISEKMAMGNDIGDSDTVMKAAEEAAKKFIAFDMESLAAETGCVISSIMFGAIAGSGRLPFTKENFEDAIRAEGKMVAANLKGFDAGYRSAENSTDRPGKKVTPLPLRRIDDHANTPAAKALRGRINALPVATLEYAYAGARKLLDYQDLDYAATYVTILEEFAARDKAPYDLSNELARYLALWMAFDDVIRVADIKTRSERVSKYRQEIRAADDQIVHMVEFMHPRLEEIIGTMPVGLANMVQKSPALRWLFGKFTGPKHSDTTKISSFLMLYFLASLKPLRRRTLRFSQEYCQITTWLSRIKDVMADDYDLAIEIIRCQRLIKGYGETHERGMGNFLSIMAVIDADDMPVDANTVTYLRKAALADDQGRALKQALAEIQTEK